MVDFLSLFSCVTVDEFANDVFEYAAIPCTPGADEGHEASLAMSAKKDCSACPKTWRHDEQLPQYLFPEQNLQVGRQRTSLHSRAQVVPEAEVHSGRRRSR